MTAVVEATVMQVRQLSPSFVRITFAGCASMTSHGYDQRIKILLALPGQDRPVLPLSSDWYGEWCAMPSAVRPIMRTFTIRSQDGDLVDIEFALHGDAGPASAWARAARPGSVLGIVGPTPDDDFRAVQYEPGEHDWQLFVGDDTALPAISSLLETLPASVDARVFVQIPHQRDIRELPRDVTWTVGGGLAEAVRSADLPAGTAYAWVAAEAAIVRDVRRYLCRERGWDSKAHCFSGYWKAGETE
ncbi:siderophore-interacting protein [Actinoplanes sp. TFC3]|uniref:siderophore-interacting protein n=1 Tax=Actinoplanes sp. TFC3 TaxID=1710355 RepID=UPI00082F9196|nr:siderophore-interacting protein [Actinoplanes sp. TFC3]